MAQTAESCAHSGIYRLLLLASVAIAALFCTGCAAPESIATGVPESEVVARLGPPHARHPLPDGSSNLEYTSAPAGQQTWMINVEGSKVVRVAQVLTSEEFSKIRIRVDTKSEIKSRFGQTVDEIHLALSDRDVWSYRMKQDGVWPVWMNVQFDAQGVVREVFPTPDPATLRDRDGRP